MTAENNRPSAPRLAGLALAGGRSRRFGREKAMALLGGSPLLAWSLATLDARCRPVAVSAAPGSGAEALARAGDRIVLNDLPGHPAGPLAGVAAGLTWAAAQGCAILVVLPCDTPLVRPEHIDGLVAGLGDAAAAYARAAGDAHGLCSAWRTSLAPELNARLEHGEHPAVRRLLVEIGARAVAFDDAAAFGNVNAPSDLARLRPPASQA